eukprot:scaffold11636_cov62-Cyclotella_meneghiniana.AAC.5
MGGNPELAREFARWLYHYEDNIGVIENAIEKTNCGEALASARLLIHSSIFRPYNRESKLVKIERVMAERRQKKQNDVLVDDSEEHEESQNNTDVTDGPKIQKTKDAERVTGLLGAFHEFNQEIKTLQQSSPQEFKENRMAIEADMQSRKSKQTHKSIQERKDEISKKLAKAGRKHYAAERPSAGMYIPASIGGGIQLGVLLKGEHESAIDKEITSRNIILTKPLKDISWTDKKMLLKKDELSRLAPLGKHFKSDGTPKEPKDIDVIEPVSDELRALLPAIAARLAEKREKKAARAMAR